MVIRVAAAGRWARGPAACAWVRVCVSVSASTCVRVCVRGAGRSTHHLAGGARPLRGRIGNVEASLASSATCWLKHQLGQNKKLLKKKSSQNYGNRAAAAAPPARRPARPLPGSPAPGAARMCPAIIMIINNALRLIIEGLFERRLAPGQRYSNPLALIN